MLLGQWRDAAEPADAVIRPLQLQQPARETPDSSLRGCLSNLWLPPPTNGNAKGDLPESEAITTFKTAFDPGLRVFGWSRQVKFQRHFPFLLLGSQLFPNSLTPRGTAGAGGGLVTFPTLEFLNWDGRSPLPPPLSPSRPRQGFYDYRLIARFIFFSFLFVFLRVAGPRPFPFPTLGNPVSFFDSYVPSYTIHVVSPNPYRISRTNKLESWVPFSTPY